MKKRMMSTLEIVSKTMVQPLMYLSVVGIIMVIGVLLTNKTVTEILPFLQWGPIKLLGTLIYQGMMVVINNLATLFCVGIAAAVAKKEKHQAAILAFISLIIFLTANNVTLTSFGKLAEPQDMLGLIGTGQGNVLGIQVLDTGVFGGIILGFIVGAVYNRTADKRFSKAWLQMWSGAKWSLVWLIGISIALGFATTFVWPPIQYVIESTANIISRTGNFGLFLYGFLERILIPTGLHHLIYAPFQFSPLGGVIEMDGQTISGAYAVFMAEMSNPNITEFSDTVRWMTTAFTKTFGYIGIVAAFIHTAKPENKDRIKTMLIPLVVTSFMVSITEPIDFLFVFAAPVLFFTHAVIAGSFMVLINVLGIRASTSGLSGIILNIALGAEKTKWPLLMLLAVIQIALYFFLFSFLIKKFNLKTPGREEVIVEEKNKVATPEVVKPAIDENEIKELIQALGGEKNIVSVDNCFTRLRVSLYDTTKLKKGRIDQMQHSGIVEKGNDIQIIFGLNVTDISYAVKKELGF